MVSEPDLQPKNSAVHAIEYLRDCLKRHAGNSNVVVSRLQEALYWLENSIKFLGPANGEFLQRVDLLADEVDFPHLPFDAICLEYEHDYRTADFKSREGMVFADAQDQPDRVCALAFYPDESTPVGRLVAEHYGKTSGEFVVWPISGYKAGSRALDGEVHRHSRWVPVLDPVLVTRERRSNSAVEMRSLGGDKRILLQALTTPESLALRAGNRLRLGAGIERQDVLREVTHECTGEAFSVVELCNLLECINVTAQTVAAPEKLNRKRREAGKVPLFEYRVLQLRALEAHDLSRGGTHASPRFHHRRGHIRRLAGDRKTWVRPHIVGEPSRGMIVKDYQVDPAK